MAHSGALRLGASSLNRYEFQKGPVVPTSLKDLHEIYDNPSHRTSSSWTHLCVHGMESAFECVVSIPKLKTSDGYVWEVAHFFAISSGIVGVLFPEKVGGMSPRHSVAYYLADQCIDAHPFPDEEVEELLGDLNRALAAQE